VGFYALAAAGAIKLLRLILSLAVRGYFLIAKGRAVDYSEMRETWHERGGFAYEEDWEGQPKRKRVRFSLWQMLTWWVTGYSQRQSVTKVALTNLSSSRGFGSTEGGPQATVRPEANFGPPMSENPRNDEGP